MNLATWMHEVSLTRNVCFSFEEKVLSEYKKDFSAFRQGCPSGHFVKHLGPLGVSVSQNNVCTEKSVFVAKCLEYS